MNRINVRQPAAHTQAAARACMANIRATDAALQQCPSPLMAMTGIVEGLIRDPFTSRQLAVVSASRSRRPASSAGDMAQSTLASAWPLRFDAWAAKPELPLIYLTSSETSAQLCALSSESGGRGIFCNDIETLPSRWPKGAHPWLPLWLLANPQCQPFDPANAGEARAITLHALRSLYVEGRAGFYYMALHDDVTQAAPLLSDSQAVAALRGMYRVSEVAVSSAPPRIHLLGAGRALAAVRQAAQLLSQRWQVTVEVWSCPSYTRLARDAESAKRWNRLHPDEARRSWHLRDCLGEGPHVVLAVTGYPQAVVEQVRAHVPGRFVALGADSPEFPADPSARAESIVLQALRALADDGQMAYDVVARARQGRFPA